MIHSDQNMNKPRLNILLIEDNIALAKQICRFMEGLNWRVYYSEKGTHGITLALENTFDVIVLDLNLPDCDGLVVCEKIKKSQPRTTPILMLTARDAFEDKTKGFATGTDEYLTKPFDLRELALRCEALARRPQLHTDSTIQKGLLALDTRALSATWQGEPIKTTKLGFKILVELTKAYPYPVARSDLLQALWGDEPPESNALKSHMYTLRKSLDDVCTSPILKTISNIGYQLQGLEHDL